MKIKKGDNVVVIAGKDRTKTGKVLRVFPTLEKLHIEGIVRTKHKRANRQGKKGEVIHIPFPVAASAVKLVCPKCGKATRVGYSVSGDKKTRVCKKCDASLE